MARILLVNDDIAEISAVKRVLARAGHHPVLATNAQDAITSAAQAPPELIVVGATCEGGDALRRIAEDEAAGAIPLVVLGEPGEAPAGTAWVARPIDPEQLAEQVTASLAAAPTRPAAPRKAAEGRTPARATPTNGRASGTAATRTAAAGALRMRSEQPPRSTGLPAQAPPARRAARDPVAAPLEIPALAAAAIDPDDPGLEAILRRAEEAERAHAAERKARARQKDRATVEAAHRAEAEDLVIEGVAHARAAERRARAEERARQEAERKAADEAAARERAEQERREAEERAENARRAAEKERRAAEAARRAAREERRATEERARQERLEVEKRAEEERRAVEQRAEEERRATEERALRAGEQQGRRAAETEERARAEQEARRAAEAEERARAEQEARRAAEAKARVEAGARRRAEAERRAAEAERRAAEERARRETSEEARRAAEADERARAEADARKRLEDELEQLRTEVETERRSAQEQIQSVMERAATEERAAEDLHRLAAEEAQHQLEKETQRRLEEEARRRSEEEETLRTAISSARSEMEVLRRKNEQETRRRTEAEAEVARLARAAERRAADAVPLPDADESSGRGRAVRPGEEPEPPPPQRRAEPAPSGEEAPRRDLRRPPVELRAGTLAEVPAPRLLALAAREAMSGRLDIEGEVTRSIWLDEGRVVGAASDDPGERVEELALRLGLVTRDQHRQIAGATASLTTRRAALLLLERGFLKPTELTSVVRRRTEEVLFGAFADAAARFRWIAEEVPPDERTALDRSTLALAVEGVRRRWLAPQVEAVLGGAGTLLAPAAGGPLPEDLGLSSEERQAVALADGLRSLDEIVSASPIDPLSTRQVLAALVLVGSLAVRVFQGGKPAATATEAIDLARVREKLDQVRRADYFTIMGVGRLCTPHEVRQASERLLAEFEPRRYQGIREDDLPGRLEEILRVVADAREILVDDRLRSEYLRGLGDER